MGRAARRLRRKNEKGEAVELAEEAQEIADRLLEANWKYGALVLRRADGSPEAVLLGKTYSPRDISRLLNEVAEDCAAAEVEDLLDEPESPEGSGSAD